MECVIKVLGRREMGLPPTTNGKSRPERTMILPVGQAVEKSKEAIQASLAEHVVGCSECHPDHILMAAEEAADGRMGYLARTLLKRDPRVTPWLAVASAAQDDILGTFTMKVSPEEWLRGVSFARPLAWQVAENSMGVVDGKWVQEGWKALDTRRGNPRARIGGHRYPLVKSIPPGIRNLAYMAFYLVSRGYKVPGSADELHEFYTMLVSG